MDSFSSVSSPVTAIHTHTAAHFSPLCKRGWPRDACSHDSAQIWRRIKITFRWPGFNDGDAEPIRGRSVSSSLEVRIPFTGEGKREPCFSARHALITEKILGQLSTAHTTSKLNCSRGTFLL